MNLGDLRQKPHLSASSIGDYIDCGMLYKFGRVDRLPREFVADAMEFGTVIHKVLAEYLPGQNDWGWNDAKGHSRKLQGASGMKLQRAEMISNMLREKISTAILMQGIDLLTAWYSKIEDNNYRVLAIEEAFSFNLPNIPIPIIGATDLVEEDERRDNNQLRILRPLESAYGPRMKSTIICK